MGPISPHRMGEVYGNNLYVSFPLHPKPGKSFLSQASHLDLASLDDLREAPAVSMAHWQYFTAAVLTENLKREPARLSFHTQLSTFSGLLLLQAVGPNQVGPRILRLAAFPDMGSGWLKLEGQEKKPN